MEQKVQLQFRKSELFQNRISLSVRQKIFLFSYVCKVSPRVQYLSCIDEKSIRNKERNECEFIKIHYNNSMDPFRKKL